MEYTIKLFWDKESYVWVATSEDIQGLALESGSLDALIERVKFAVPELLVINGSNEESIDICFLAERHDRVLSR